MTASSLTSSQTQRLLTTGWSAGGTGGTVGDGSLLSTGAVRLGAPWGAVAARAEDGGSTAVGGARVSDTRSHRSLLE